MFTKWLETQVVTSWDQLLEALKSRSVQLVHLANEIDQMLDNENDSYGKEIIVKCHESVPICSGPHCPV